ncbi:hypothetical protein LTR56_017528 [Elasticomyces elasticus]|nr:hypothetical protein LTR22_022388 [Elasticomyces elasticus]KAK3630240.1 hypothetical protein LTR56_017528 [Elasticomyces elasticus]KAK4913922.1 hypothetical protein LTR49_017848 [Elasticomyces elasticus]KAK5766383.1 hypothetical protein LTS12_003595 [Elasticomyces elasticus]
MHITIPDHPRSARAAVLGELAWPSLFLALSLAFTIPFFVLKTSHAASNDEPSCRANGEAIFPWNHTVNEHWDPATALFITLGTGSYTYPEAKSIDVIFDLLVGRGGQVVAAMMAFTVIRKSLFLSIEEKPVPLPLTFAVYFSGPLSLLWAIFENLTIPVRARKHKDKAVSCWRLAGWIYLCGYVLILPTLLSAMTGYQTSASIYFHPGGTSSSILASSDGLLPNPSLKIRDGSRVGLDDGEFIQVDRQLVGLGDTDEHYNTILGYYLSMQDALYNTTWHPPTISVTLPGLRGTGPIYSSSIGVPAYAYCTVTPYGDYCNEIGSNSYHSPPPPDPPPYQSPESMWSNITLDNHTYVLQPPPLDIVWAGPAETWALALTSDRSYGGYFSNASIARTAVCQPSTQYQWGFSTVLLFLFCCMTIVFAATLLALEVGVWLHSRSNLYQQRRSGYRDAVYVVQALKDEFGEDLVENSPEDIDSRVKSYTGAMQVETGNLELSRSESNLLKRRTFRRARNSKQEVQPEIPLLETTDVFATASKWR